MTARIPRSSLALFVALVGSWVTAPVHAQAPVYQVDLSASRVYVRVGSATRLGHPHGIGGNLAASTISFGGKGELVFDTTSFVADTPEARQYVGLEGRFADAQKVTANMLGEAVLNVERHPRAVYAITTVAPLDGQAAGQTGRYKLTGQLTLRGVTQPVEFVAQVEPASKPGTLRMRGQFTIQQTRFGIQPYSALGGLVRVVDELTIWGDLILAPAAK